MALKLITAAVKTMAGGGVAGGAAAAAGSAASKLLGGKDEEKIIKSGDAVKQEVQAQALNQPQEVPTATPEAVKGFAAYLSKEIKVAERVHEEEIKNRTYAGLTRESTIATLLKGLKSSAIVLESNAKFAINDARQKTLQNKRNAEEQKVEGGLGDLASDVFGKVSGYAGNVKDGVLAALSPFMTPALLFGGAFLAEKMNSLLPERFRDTDLETVLNTVDMAADKVASLSATVGLQAMASKVKAAGTVSLQKMGLAKPPPAAAVAVQTVVGKVNPQMSRYQQYLSKLGGMRNWLAGLQKASNGIVAGAAKWIANLPPKMTAFLKRTMGKVLKWFLIFEAISFMYNSTQAFILGSITKDEWHKRNKEQITKIIRLFGGPYLTMMIFAAAGTIVPVLGNLGGGIAGLIVGILLGDEVFDVLKMNLLVEGLYDVFFLGKWDTLKSFANGLVARIMWWLPKMLAEYAFDAAKGIVTAPLDIARALTADRIATDEEISSEYGEDIGSAELLFKAGKGLGTDENAMLYAFKDIDTPEKYTTFKKEFEEKYLPEYNKGFGRNVNTMEEYLQKELSRSEYEQLKTQVTNQFNENAKNEQSNLKSFFRQIGYEETPTIAGIGEVTDEEYAKWMSGELVDVVKRNGEKVLMTEQELLESDNVYRGLSANERAVDRMKMRQRKNNVPPPSIEQTPIVGESSSQSDDVEVNFSREVFLNNDPENYKKYTDYYNSERTKLFDAKLQSMPESDRTKSVFRDHAFEEAKREARVAAAVAFKNEIEAAGAGEIKIVPSSSGNVRPQRETVVEGTQATPIKDNTSEVAVATAEAIDQAIVPTMDKVGQNLIVLNQAQANQQKVQSPPIGTEGPSVATSAYPSRSTTDSFVDLAYVT